MRYLKKILPFIIMLLLPFALIFWSEIQVKRAVYDNSTYIKHVANLKSHTKNSQLHDFYKKLVEIDIKNRETMPTRNALAKTALGLSILALISSFFCLVKIYIDALRARLSEKYLCNHFAKSWTILSYGLSLYVGLLITALILNISYEILGIWSKSTGSDWLWAVIFFSIVFMGTLIVGLTLIYRIHKNWSIHSLSPSIYSGRTLTRQNFPKLWQWIETLARTLNAPVPDHIIIGLDSSFFVTSADLVLQPSNQILKGHTLYLPLPFLTALSQEEAQAIIGHELTHFINKDTIRSSKVNTQFTLLCEHLYEMQDTGRKNKWMEIPVFWMAERFLYRFQIAVYHWGRKQEFLADEGGAQFAGKTVFAQALLRVIAISKILDQLSINMKTDHFMDTLNNTLQNMTLVVDANTLESSTTHPFDTHPPVRLRLENLGINIDSTLISHATRKPQDEDLIWFANLMSNE
ncbi:M48 family metallopeptidase [Acinetobacter sp. WU_MDCI_Axc73]|nr:M48 family metallopeptidase [Acinetobacter sp. WU_MDCI_Axc73]